MGIIGKDFTYKKIKNFLSEDEVKLLSNYCEIRHRTNITNFDQSKEMGIPDSKFYGDLVMESLMLKQLPLMEKETGTELLPTYAFWRCYTKFSSLSNHVDRRSCEISVTLNINSDNTPWPIYINGEPIHLDKGEAVIYLGRQLPHYREEFQGDFCIQAFLHYVNKNGKNADRYLDTRPFWGMSEDTAKSIE
jgi:hypothetical protein|tara:strand:- start:234 stop:806 length:573 start_codon:yes stop_codon:yes gene_type:complete